MLCAIGFIYAKKCLSDIFVMNRVWTIIYTYIYITYEGIYLFEKFQTDVDISRQCNNFYDGVELICWN